MRSTKPVFPSRGFTLMEVLIAVAIVGILAAIALPSYRSYVERTNRGVAKSALAEVASRQESWYVDRKRYAASLDRLGWSGDPLFLNREGGLSASGDSHSIYRVSLQGNPASLSCPPGGSPSTAGYSVVAVPINAQAGDTACGTLCLTSTGIRSASGSSPDLCWSR